MRKIIGLSSTDTNLFALCDDGTVWRETAGSWNAVDEVPQDEEPAKRTTFVGYAIKVSDRFYKSNEIDLTRRKIDAKVFLFKSNADSKLSQLRLAYPLRVCQLVEVLE